VNLLRRLAIALLALALVLAACSQGDEEVARVGEKSIRLADVRALYEGNALPIDDSLRETLFRLIAADALTQALASDFGAVPDPAVADDYLQTWTATMAENGLTPAQFLEVPGATLEMVRFNARLLALRDEAIDQVLKAPETVDALFADPTTLTEVCAKHILVETQEEAEAVMDRLAAGEDFTAVAGEVSTDTGSLGGDLGCASAGTYVEAFAQAVVAAPLNEVTGPVQTEFGYHVLVVTGRTTPSRDEYLADPGAMLSADDVSGLWQSWFNGVLQNTDVTVAERYGTWTPIGIKAPETGTTTTPDE
jgi:peptidyl-prolyl cis-trans isomerase C